jgi:hypothetical protein
VGFENVVSHPRYPEVDKDPLSKAEVLLLSSEPFPFKEKHVLQLEKRFGVKCLLVEGDYFSWYGSRMAGAFEYFNVVHRQLA